MSTRPTSSQGASALGGVACPRRFLNAAAATALVVALVVVVELPQAAAWRPDKKNKLMGASFEEQQQRVQQQQQQLHHHQEAQQHQLQQQLEEQTQHREQQSGQQVLEQEQEPRHHHQQQQVLVLSEEAQREPLQQADARHRARAGLAAEGSRPNVVGAIGAVLTELFSGEGVGAHEGLALPAGGFAPGAASAASQTDTAALGQLSAGRSAPSPASPAALTQVFSSMVERGGDEPSDDGAETNAGKANFGQAAEANSDVDPAIWGKEGCKCVGISQLQGRITLARSGSKKGSATYDMEVGSYCKAWDEEAYAPDCTSPSPPDWCKRKWCFVDPCECNGAKAAPSAIAATLSTLGRGLSFSYETCGETHAPEREDGKSMERLEESTALNDLGEAALLETSRKADGDGDEAVEGEENAMQALGNNCPAPDESVYGKRGCRCIGLESVGQGDRGSFAYTASSKTLAGGSCGVWKNSHHEEVCRDENVATSDPFCSQSWCFVDPCTCNVANRAVPNVHTFDAQFQGVPVYVSFATCKQIEIGVQASSSLLTQRGNGAIHANRTQGSSIGNDDVKGDKESSPLQNAKVVIKSDGHGKEIVVVEGKVEEGHDNTVSLDEVNPDHTEVVCAIQPDAKACEARGTDACRWDQEQELCIVGRLFSACRARTLRSMAAQKSRAIASSIVALLIAQSAVSRSAS